MRIGYEMPGAPGSTRIACRRSPDLFPRHSVVNQWDLLAPLGIDDCTPERDPVEMTEDAARRSSAFARGSRRPASTTTHRTRRRARERGQRVPALAGRLVLLDDRRPRRARSAPPHHRRLGTVGCERQPRVSPTRPGRGCPGPNRLPPLLDWDLGELHALIARAAVYIGGDSGPLHVASTTSDADRRAARADTARAIPSVAGSAAAAPRWSTPVRCRAGRAISAAAYPGTSGA